MFYVHILTPPRAAVARRAIDDALMQPAREAAMTARAVRAIVHRVVAALEDGMLDEVHDGLAEMTVAVELMRSVNAQMEHALPVLDATTPTLGMVNATLGQLDTTVNQLAE